MEINFIIYFSYEQAKITTWIAELGVHFFLGLKYNNATKAFEWASGEQLVYSHWAEFEPGNLMA